MLDFIVQGFVSALVPENLLVMFIGLLVGIVGGMLPGITTVTAVALFVPFTFSMSPEMALIALGGVFCGAMYGGANAAILINTPGTPGSIATSLDGYPLTRQGRAEEACYVALLASTLGGIFGVVALMLFFEPLSKVALSFGSEAFFWMGLFGLSTLAAMFPGHIAKGLLGGAMGLALGTVGLDPVMGMPRFTFDVFSLVQGLDMVALMIGLFSVSQMFVMLESNETYIVSMARQAHALKRALIAVLRHLRLLGVASAIGTFIGALPGAGGSVAALVSYNEAKRWDKNPDRYGQGAIEGILVPESANNASVGGSLVPLLSLGIPGSAAAAVLAGGLMAQGLTPGPQLMEKNPDIAYAFIVSMILANIGMLFIGYLLVRICTRILDVPKLLIIPAVISISFLGAYALRNSMFDVMLMIVSGAIAYVLLKAHIMPAAIALGLVLGRIIEENLIVTCYRAQAKDSLADLLVFSPMAVCQGGVHVAGVHGSRVPRLQYRRGALSRTQGCRERFMGLAAQERRGTRHDPGSHFRRIRRAARTSWRGRGDAPAAGSRGHVDNVRQAGCGFATAHGRRAQVPCRLSEPQRHRRGQQGDSRGHGYRLYCRSGHGRCAAYGGEVSFPRNRRGDGAGERPAPLRQFYSGGQQACCIQFFALSARFCWQACR